MSKVPKIIAFYLPQFHPIEENNQWWGPGFTEWTNVAQARPRYSGHYQPHIPADLGFYDLRLEDTRIKQAELAKQYGIHGFCYYHYWFNGKMLLEQPFNQVLESGKPDFPFCICWANENWTRAWDGLERQVLIRQEYSEQDNLAHIEWLINAFRDDRYIKIDGRPLLLVYRLDNIPNLSSLIEKWRDRVQQYGFPDLYLCAVKNGFVNLSDEEILAKGFDGIVDFQPNRNDFPATQSFKSIIYSLVRRWFPDAVYQKIKLSVSANNIVDYRAMAKGLINKVWPKKYRKYPCVFASWDNTPRRKTPTIIQNEDPSIYQEWLEDSIIKVQDYPASEQIVFLNAWNEWAEGCHLEPDVRHGRQFLEATNSALSNAETKSR